MEMIWLIGLGAAILCIFAAIYYPRKFSGCKKVPEKKQAILPKYEIQDSDQKMMQALQPPPVLTLKPVFTAASEETEKKKDTPAVQETKETEASEIAEIAEELPELTEEKSELPERLSEEQVETSTEAPENFDAEKETEMSEREESRETVENEELPDITLEEVPDDEPEDEPEDESDGEEPELETKLEKAEKAEKKENPEKKSETEKSEKGEKKLTDKEIMEKEKSSHYFDWEKHPPLRSSPALQKKEKIDNVNETDSDEESFDENNESH
jgi:hypothetical protein